MKTIFRMVIVILVFVLMSGCSKKYLDSREEELLDRKNLSTWKALDLRIVKQDDEGLSLNLKVNEFVAVKDSLNVKEIYKRGFEQEDGSMRENSSFSISLGLMTGCFGCLMIGYEGFQEELMDMKDGFGASCAIGVICCYNSLLFTFDGLRQKRESIKTNPAYIQIDTVCVDSVSLFEEEIKINVKNTNFEKMYHTDEKGNITMEINEIIPQPTEGDSIIELVIQYEDMIDSVDVKCLKNH